MRCRNRGGTFPNCCHIVGTFTYKYERILFITPSHRRPGPNPENQPQAKHTNITLFLFLLGKYQQLMKATKAFYKWWSKRVWRIKSLDLILHCKTYLSYRPWEVRPSTSLNKFLADSAKMKMQDGNTVGVLICVRVLLQANENAGMMACSLVLWAKIGGGQRFGACEHAWDRGWSKKPVIFKSSSLHAVLTCWKNIM